MKKAFGVLMFAPAASALYAPPAAAQHPEEAAVRKAREHYLQGHATGDSMEFKKAFHPEARLFWIHEGKFMWRTSASYISGAPGKPATDEAQRKRYIASIDIAGNAATAKIILAYPRARLTDYMALLKIDGEWKIINKIFHAEPKPQTVKN